MTRLLKPALLLLCLLPALSQAEVVLKGKTSSRVSAHVVRANTLTVTDPLGGWYEQGVAMTQPGAFNSPYQVTLPLRVTSSSGLFQVSLGNPLVLQHQENPLLKFTQVEVKMGAVDGALQPLSLTGRPFRTPPAPLPGEESTGDFVLQISAVPPVGEFDAVTGTYSGVLSLTFEPVLEDA